MTSAAATEIRSSLEAVFRHRVAFFYQSLHITPPYHSVEKATLSLRESLAPLSLPALQALAGDDASMCALFTLIVRESGLSKKHRGIIKGLLREGSDRLPPECRPFADAYRT